MTDAERWRTVAAWFEKAAEARVRHDVPHGAMSGLCYAAYKAGIDRRSEMYAVLGDAGVGRWTFAGATFDNQGLGWRNMARFRATIALLMAHMAEDDGGNHREDAP